MGEEGPAGGGGEGGGALTPDAIMGLVAPLLAGTPVVGAFCLSSSLRNRNQFPMTISYDGPLALKNTRFCFYHTTLLR